MQGWQPLADTQLLPTDPRPAPDSSEMLFGPAVQYSLAPQGMNMTCSVCAVFYHESLGRLRVCEQRRFADTCQHVNMWHVFCLGMCQQKRSWECVNRAPKAAGNPPNLKRRVLLVAFCFTPSSKKEASASAAKETGQPDTWPHRQLVTGTEAALCSPICFQGANASSLVVLVFQWMTSHQDTWP